MPTRGASTWRRSRSAPIALHLATTPPLADAGPGAIVLLGAADRLEVTRDVWWAPWSSGDSYDALALAPRVRRDVLQIHGERDEAIPLAQAHELGAALGGMSRFLALPARGHGDLLQDREVFAEARRFLESPAPR